MESRFWVVCYDIREEKRLRRVAKVMERYGTRIQKSVFECWFTFRLLHEMLDAVNGAMDAKADSLRLYPLCQNCRELAKSEVGCEIAQPKGYYIA